jgi:hypothetical protein
MYKLHKPHLDHGYIASVEFEKIVDAGGELDWNIWYVPGPRAKDEYGRFNPSRRASGVAIDTDDHLLPRGQSAAEELVTHFQTTRFGKAKRRIAPKEIKMAEELIATHGLEKSKNIISEALRATIERGTKPLWMTELKTNIEENLDG